MMRMIRRLKHLLAKPEPEPDFFLKKVNGVVHVGANTGQEREIYDRHGLNVAWIEPIPAVFEKLEQNIASYPKQRAFRYLLADQDNWNVEFKVASNDGASSSILEIGAHQEIWPEVHFTDVIQMQAMTFGSFVVREGINMSDYQALVMDTQGTELLVLKGAGDLVRKFDFIKTEAADFESYLGCCQVRDLDEFLANHGFVKIRCTKFADYPKGGGYYDLVYARDR